MACKDCSGNSQTSDQKIIEIAKQRAKEENKSVGLYRDELGQLCIATGNEPVFHIITPNMQ